MKIKVTQNFQNYSETAINRVVDTCSGKPFNDLDGSKMGTILNGRRIPHSRLVEFEIQMDVEMM